MQDFTQNSTQNNALPPLPGGFLRSLPSLLGDETAAFLSAFDALPHKAARYRSRPAAPPGAQVPWEENAFLVPSDTAMGQSPLHHAGAYYLQDPSAMAPARALAPQSGDVVLDLCAAPGGKSTQLGALLGGSGALIANEPIPKRAKVLSGNLERMGIANAIVLNEYPDALALRFPQFFDRILVDAPCSGEGMFRKNPEARLEWSENAVQSCARRQQDILSAAAGMLKPGGTLVYSTCTFNRTENEDNVALFLRRHPDFSLVPICLPGIAPNSGTVRLWPHRHVGEGHFVCKMQKQGAAAPTPLAAPALPAAERRAWAPFADLTQGLALQCPMPNGVFKETAVYTPLPLSLFAGLKVERLGLHLATRKGKTILPHHALSHALPMALTLPVTEAAALKYLHGESLPAPDGLKGFVAITFEGHTLGLGKAGSGQVNNHYPKGLRIP